ncbi:MAG TPA: PxKF domain-containing protein [Pyrinomonadaceae bacterium]
MPGAFSAGAGAPLGGGTGAAARPAAAPVAFAPIISATKTDAFPDPDNDGKAVPGDTITYTVQITNSGSDATGVNFSDTVDANTTFVPGSVTTTPVAAGDAYTAIGNVQINVPAGSGLTANDSDPDGDTLTASGPATSTAGGNVTVNADGSFTYNPPPGFEGADTFTYSVTDGDSAPDTATVTVNVGGMIWFVDSSAAAGGDGRLTSPFNALTGAGSFDAVAADDQNDNIFLYDGPYSGGLALQSGQALIGEGAGASLATITGLTPPSYSTPLPATGGSDPVIGTSGVSVATNNLIRGLTIANTTGTGLSGSGYGTLAVAETTINAAGRALSLDNGQPLASFDAISSANSTSTGVSLTNVAMNSVFSGGATSVSGAAGVGILITNVGAGSNLSFGQTDILGRSGTGVELDNVDGALAFGATTIPNPNDSTGYGINLRNSAGAVTFGSATISNTKLTQAQIDTNLDFIPDNDGNGDAIFLKDNTGSFAVNGGVISNCDNDCIDIRNSSNISLFGVAIQNPGVTASGTATASGTGGHGIQAINLSGTNSITSTNISDFDASGRDGLRIINNAPAAMTFTVDASTFSHLTPAAGSGNGIFIWGYDNADMALTVQGNSVFSNLVGAAIAHAAGANANSTATVNLTVQNSTFQNAAFQSGTILGQNTVHAAVAQGGKAAVLVAGNTFNNVARTALDTSGVVDVNGNGTLAGNSLSFTATNNTITNIGDNTPGSCGALPCSSRRGIDVFLADSTAVSGTVVIDGNQITDVKRVGIFFDIGSNFNGSNVAAKITNNTVGTSGARVGTTGVGEHGIRVENRNPNGKSLNLNLADNSIFNGNGGSGSTTNTPGVFMRVLNTNSFSATVTNNTIDTSTSNAVAELIAITQNAGSTFCLDATGNTLAGGASGQITLNETAGALNVEQATQAALSAANNNAAVTQTGSPNYGVACAAPPLAMFRTNANREYLAALGGPAAKAARGFAYLSGSRPDDLFQPLPGLDAWRANSKLRQGGLSYRYAAGSVALGSSLSDVVVRPAREAAAEPLTYAPAAAPLAFSGETISLAIGTLPAGKSMTITFQATINNSINAAQVSNQGEVTADGGVSVLTDDPATGAFGDPTVTPVGAPATISCPANINANTDPGQFSASVAFSVTGGGSPAPTVNCKVGATTITSPHTFPVGTTTVQCSATNGIGSPAACSFDVTVNDNQTPLISCPANITTGTSAGSCDATVNVGTPTVSDNDPNVTVNGVRSDALALNAPYPKGVTTITWTAKDTANNSASCQQTVTVNDDDAPVVTVSGANPATVLQGSAFVDPGATATDTCDGALAVSVSGTVNTAVVGTYTLTYSATDSAGNTGTATRTVNVVYNFTGFFSPVSNPPALNEVKAGQGIPIKFSLGGNQGLNIFAAGYPASQQVGCADNVPVNVLEETNTAGNSTLSYSGGVYTYNWKTEKSWAGTCRVFTIVLTDGSTHTAYFKFK